LQLPKALPLGLPRVGEICHRLPVVPLLVSMEPLALAILSEQLDK